MRFPLPADYLLEKAVTAKRESRSIDFKQQFDTESTRDWCEVLKDIVAIANSGGGVILVGLNNYGIPAGTDVGSLLDFDSANLANKIFSYTTTNFDQIQVVELSKDGHRIAAIQIGAAEIPIAFTRTGTYPNEGGQQGVAFHKGSVYFRHGSKSEPANCDDLRIAFEKRLGQVRKEWMSGLRKVVQAPSGSVLKVLPQDIRDSSDPDAVPIRIVTDESAPGYRLIDYDKTHPLRQMDVLAALKKTLPHGTRFNTFDFQCIRVAHRREKNDQFFHRPLFSSPRYSNKLVTWIAKEYEKDDQFVNKAREAYRKKKMK